jgi:hypothetical protein
MCIWSNIWVLCTYYKLIWLLNNLWINLNISWFIDDLLLDINILLDYIIIIYLYYIIFWMLGIIVVMHEEDEDF